MYVGILLPGRGRIRGLARPRVEDAVEVDVQEEKGKDVQAKEERDKQMEEATCDMEPKEEAVRMEEEQEDEVHRS